VWADDFHHLSRRITAGDVDGYFQDFSDEAADLAETIRRGWFYTGQHSAYGGHARGTEPTGIAPCRMVVCLQNHDQIGNRAFGDRLHHGITPAVYRALSVLLLLVPETPLLFMGQEWAASTPFQYFTDHTAELGRLVTEGRRREFGRFAAFQDEAARRGIPDPQALATFEASRLCWEERGDAGHAGVLALYRALLDLRRTHPACRSDARVEAAAPDRHTVMLSRLGAGGEALLVVARLRAAGDVTVPSPSNRPGGWSMLLDSEDPAYADEGRLVSDRPVLVASASPSTLVFHGPAAVVLRAS
jgi:maltooligosyltrehalose trehalohydrolase